MGELFCGYVKVFFFVRYGLFGEVEEGAVSGEVFEEVVVFLCFLDEGGLFLVELVGEVVDDGVAGVEFFLEVVEFLGAPFEAGLVCGEVCGFEFEFLV